jgi:hypothetical protein
MCWLKQITRTAYYYKKLVTIYSCIVSKLNRRGGGREKKEVKAEEEIKRRLSCSNYN